MSWRDVPFPISHLTPVAGRLPLKREISTHWQAGCFFSNVWLYYIYVWQGSRWCRGTRVGEQMLVSGNSNVGVGEHVCWCRPTSIHVRLHPLCALSALHALCALYALFMHFLRVWNAAELDLLKSAKPKPRRKQFSRDPMVYVLKPVLRISTYSLLILFPNLTDYALEVEQVCAAQLPLLNQLQVSLCRAWCRDVCPGGSQA